MTTATATATRPTFLPMPGVPGTATTWALDLRNAYGETRAAAITRAERALADLADSIGDCHGYCEGDREDAAYALRDLTAGDVYEFSLDGAAVETWTIRADSAEAAAARAEDEHETFCLIRP